MSDNDKLDLDITLNDHESQADQLHGVVEEKKRISSSDWGYNDDNHIKQLSAHPNTTTEHLSNIYSHLAPKDGEIDKTYSDSLEHIFSSNKVSPEIAKDYLSRTLDNHDNYHFRDSHSKASEVGGVPTEFLQDLTNKALENPKLKTTPTYKLPAKFLHDTFSQRVDSNPPEGNLNEIQQAHNDKMSKLDFLFFKGVPKAEHTEEEFDLSVNKLTSPTMAIGQKFDDKITAANNFLERDDLKPHHIEKIFETYKDHEAEGYSETDGEEIALNTFKNPNVDPAFVSKVALSENYNKNARDIALTSPSLPEETALKVVQSYNKEENTSSGWRYTSPIVKLAENPNVSTDLLNEMYKAGNERDQAAVIMNKNASPEVINHFWENTDKKTDAVSTILKVPNVTPEILTDIVSKNKNQDLAVEALNHKSVTLPVVEAGLKRKAAKVKEAASKHPLVAKQQTTERLSDGRLHPAEFLRDKELLENIGGINEEHISIIDKLYSEKPADQYKRNDIGVKEFLATDKNVPQEIQEKHKTELISMADFTREAANMPSNSADAVIRIAEGGDIEAQSALLKNKNSLDRIDFRQKALSSSFLGESYKAFQEKEGSQKIEKTRIARNPSAPQEVFDDFFSDPKNHEDFSAVRSDNKKSYQINTPESPVTVFDDRYSDLSEQEKEFHFEKLLNLQNEDVNYSVAMSNSVPKSSFDKAFSGLSNEKKADLLEESPYKTKMLDDSSYKSALGGSFGELTQRAVISALDIENESHVDNIANFIKSNYSPENDSELTPGAFLRSFNKPKNPNHPNVTKILDTSLQSNDWLGANLTLKAFSESSYGNKSYLNQSQANSIKSAFERNSVNEQSLLNKWSSLLDNKIDLSNNVNLDFLYNLPGDAENEYEIRNTALKKGFFSKELAAKAAEQSPESYRAALKSYSTKEKNNKIKEVIESENPSEDFLRISMHNFRPSTVKAQAGSYGRSALSKQEVEDSVTNTRAFAAGLARHKYIDGFAPMVMALVDSSRDNDRFTKPQQKKMVEGVLDAITNSEHLNLAQKTKAKLNIWSELTDDDKTHAIPKSLTGEIVEAAVKANDVGAILNIADIMPNPPASVSKAVNDYVKNAKKLETSDILRLSDSVNTEKTKIKDTQNLINELNSRALSDEDNSLRLNLSTIKIANNLIKSEDPDKKAAGERVILEKLDHGHQQVQHEAQKKAVNIIRDEKASMQSRVIAFNKISAKDNDIRIFPGGIQIPDGLLDQDEVLNSPDNEWKTRVYALNARYLGDNSASYLIDKIENLPERNEREIEDKNSYKIELSKRFFLNEKISNETKLKAYRPLNLQQKTSVMEEQINRDGNEFVSTSGYLGLEPLASETEEQLKNTTTNREAIDLLKNIAQVQIGEILEKYTRDQGLNHDEGQEAVDSFIERTAKIHKNITSSLISKIENSSESVSPEDFEAAIGATYEHQNTILSKRNLNLDADEALDIAMSSKKLFEVYAKIHGQEKAIELSRFKNEEDYEENNLLMAERWNRRVSVQDDKWGSILSKNPEIALSLGLRSEITGEALKAINLDNYDKGDFLHCSRNWPEIVSPSGHQELLNFNKKIGKDLLVGHQSYYNDFTKKTIKVLKNKISYEDMQELKRGKENKLLDDRAAAVGAGGKRHLNETIDNILKAKDNKRLEIIIGTADLDENLINKVMPVVLSTAKEGKNELLEIITGNSNLTPGTLSSIYNNLDLADSRTKKVITKKLQKHPNIDQKLYKKMYEDTSSAYPNKTFEVGSRFNPAYSNRKFGGKLFRDRPVVMSEEQPDTVSRDPKDIPTTVEHSKTRELLREATKLIPKEGISYGNFKKINKQLAERKEVKEVFMRSNKQFATPEDMARAVSVAGGDFHLTYATWKSYQRHMEDSKRDGAKFNNLVIQLNTGESMEKQLSEDPKLWSFYQMVQKAANNTEHDQVGSHPVTPHNAAWVRLDTSGGKDGWVIEELQSDFSSSLRSQVKDIKKQHPDGLTLDGEFYHPDEMEQHAKKIEKIISGWHEAAIKAATKVAKKNGAKQLFLHGEGVRSVMSFGANQKENPVWMQYMYTRHPKKTGWEECDYTDYPNWSEEMKKEAKTTPHGTKCWKIKI